MREPLLPLLWLLWLLPLPDLLALVGVALPLGVGCWQERAEDEDDLPEAIPIDETEIVDKPRPRRRKPWPAWWRSSARHCRRPSTSIIPIPQAALA